MQYTPRKFNFQPRKDPNAMDVDVLTAEEQSDLMRKGACFRCKAQGHLSRDCPNKERKVELKKEEKRSPGKAKTWQLMSGLKCWKSLKRKKESFMQRQQTRVFNKEGCINVYPSFTTYMYSDYVFRGDK